MNDKIKHWITMLEIIKQELIYKPYENDVLRRVMELTKEMQEAVEEERV